tara:strand:+ start:138 stop:338 length:201 start_codon:yes stop_codon:yes gene_type:complete
MIKLTYEDDTGIFGFKDKNAWTQEDATHMFQEMLKQIYNLPDNFKLIGTAELPKVKVDDHALDEGM